MIHIGKLCECEAADDAFKCQWCDRNICRYCYERSQLCKTCDELMIEEQELMEPFMED